MYDTTIILNELGITDAYKIYVIINDYDGLTFDDNDYDGLTCINDMLNIFDDNNYDCLVDPAKFINTLLNHEYNNDNVINEIINIIKQGGYINEI